MDWFWVSLLPVRKSPCLSTRPIQTSPGVKSPRRQVGGCSRVAPAGRVRDPSGRRHPEFPTKQRKKTNVMLSHSSFGEFPHCPRATTLIYCTPPDALPFQISVGRLGFPLSFLMAKEFQESGPRAPKHLAPSQKGNKWDSARSFSTKALCQPSQKFQQQLVSPHWSFCRPAVRTPGHYLYRRYTEELKLGVGHPSPAALPSGAAMR